MFDDDFQDRAFAETQDAITALVAKAKHGITTGELRRRLPEKHHRLIIDALAALCAVGTIHNAGSVLRAVYKLGAGERTFHHEQSRTGRRRTIRGI